MVHAPSLPLRTERLVLRPARAGDAVTLHDYLRSEEVCRYLPHVAQTLEECEERVATWASCVDPQADGETLLLMVELDGRHVGHCLIFRRGPELSIGEVGWVLHPDVTGRGLATEAAQALVDTCFEHYGMHRVTARLDPRNAASARVCDRLGMQREGVLRRDWLRDGEWTDTAVHALLREEWDQRPVDRHGRRRSAAT